MCEIKLLVILVLKTGDIAKLSYTNLDSLATIILVKSGYASPDPTTE